MSYFVFLLFFVNFESIVHQILTILAFYDDINVAFFLRKLLFNQTRLSRPIAHCSCYIFNLQFYLYIDLLTNIICIN